MQTKGLNRDTIDKYYTKESVVELCINKIKEYIKIGENDLIIEPSAGNGAFINSIKEISKNHIFYDLEPENSEIIKKDYLLCENDYFLNKSNKNKIHIIGNPPFGRQSSLAIKFIKKSCIYSDSISFILPKSFKKDSLKRSFSLNFHLIFEMDIPYNGFLVNNVEHDVPCVFQIWIKKDEYRKSEEKVEPKGFIFVNKNENPDISFRRVGVNAGKIDVDINKSVQSHYFIKFENKKSVKDNIEKVCKITYNFNNTVGPKSISKQELIKEFNKIL